MFEVEAANIQQMLKRLGEDHPKLKPMLERGVSVSIDGQIYRDDWFRRSRREARSISSPAWPAVREGEWGNQIEPGGFL